MARRSAESDVLYTAMSVDGIRDVRLSDLFNPAHYEGPTSPDVARDFIAPLRELYDLLPDSTTVDPRSQLDSALSSEALRKIQQIIPTLPSQLRPFRSDLGSIINIAMRLQLQLVVIPHTAGHS